MDLQDKNQKPSKARNYYWRLAPAGAKDPDNPRLIREQALHLIIFIVAHCGLIPLVLAAPALIAARLWPMLIVAAGIYLSSLTLLVWPQMPYPIRSVWPSFTALLIGLVGLLSLGPFLAAREWFLVSCLSASVFFGWPGILSALGLTLGSLISAGLLLKSGYWGQGLLINPDKSFEAFVSSSLAFLFTTTTLTIFVFLIFSLLEKAIIRARRQSTLLAGERADLLEVKKKLEQEVAARRAVQKQMENTLVRERQILDSIAAGIIVVERKTKKILFANSTALSLIGEEAETLLGRVCHGFVCPAQVDACPVVDLGQEVDCSEKVLLTTRGREIDILKTVVPLEFQGRDSLLETFLDISDRKQLEKRLAIAQKMEAVGTLAGGIAHDFNNILSIIIGFTDLARDDMSRQPQLADQHLVQVGLAAQRAKELVQQILSFSRQNPIDRRSIDLRPVIEEGLKMLRATLPVTIEIQARLGVEAVRVVADATQIHQVLINLCTNAADAMIDRGGRLVVDLSLQNLSQPKPVIQKDLAPGRYARLLINDTGSGIEPIHLDRLLEPFFTTKPTGQGTGLGLAVVHGIISEHNGGMIIDSSPGRGSTFSVFLPLDDEIPA